MGTKDILNARLELVVALFDKMRLQRHLLGREGRDLLEKVERRLMEAEHELRRGGGSRNEIARVVHDIHETLTRLRERADASLHPSPSSPVR